jgi:hypothetical protein
MIRAGERYAVGGPASGHRRRRAYNFCGYLIIRRVLFV